MKNGTSLANAYYIMQLIFLMKKILIHSLHLYAQLEKQNKLSGNRLVYCSVAPYFYCTITQGLAKSGLVKKLAGACTSIKSHSV